MRLLALLAAGLFVGVVVTAPVPKDKAKVKDEEAIVGAWELVGIELGSDQKSEPPEGERWVFDEGGKMTNIVGGKVQAEQTYKLDPTAKPKAIDMTGTLSGVSECVYELDGDTLKVCFQWRVKVGGKAVRPDEVKADDAKHMMLVTMKRVKDEKKEEKRDK